jgi:hypothetical protein
MLLPSGDYMEPKYILHAKVNPAMYPVMAMFSDKEKLVENVEMFKEKGIIHNPDWWMSELNPPYLKAHEIWVTEIKKIIKSPNEVE